MEFKNRVPNNKNRVLITPENGTSAFHAVITRQDNPQAGKEGTMLEAGIFNNLSEEIKNNKIKSEKAIEDSEKALDVVDNLSVTTTEIASTATPFVEINTTEETGRKTLNFNIPASKQGKSYRHRGIWASSLTYYNNDLYIDTVTFNGCTYYAKLTNSAKEPLDLADNTYWGLLAQRGGISNVVINDMINAIYPIGSIYMSVNATSPNTLFGGTWEQLKDRFLLGAGGSYSLGVTGGSKDAIIVLHSHTLESAGSHIHELESNGFHNHNYNSPGNTNGDYLSESSKGTAWRGSGNGWITEGAGSHTHEVNSEGLHSHTVNTTGSSGIDKNMPPYLAVYMWKRTA